MVNFYNFVKVYICILILYFFFFLQNSTLAKKTDVVVTLLTRDLVSNPSAEVRVVVVRLYEDIVSFFFLYIHIF